MNLPWISMLKVMLLKKNKHQEILIIPLLIIQYFLIKNRVEDIK